MLRMHIPAKRIVAPGYPPAQVILWVLLFNLDLLFKIQRQELTLQLNNILDVVLHDFMTNDRPRQVGDAPPGDSSCHRCRLHSA